MAEIYFSLIPPDMFRLACGSKGPFLKKKRNSSLSTYSGTQDGGGFIIWNAAKTMEELSRGFLLTLPCISLF